jgi:hypothetical protein
MTCDWMPRRVADDVRERLGRTRETPGNVLLHDTKGCRLIRREDVHVAL